MAQSKSETLRFVRVHNAKKGEMLYVETWATGYQQLIFRSHEHAKKHAEKRGQQYVGPLKEPK